MKKIWINYIVDLGLAISFILTGFTVLVMKFQLSVSMLNPRAISELHDNAGTWFIILALLHLILHLNFFMNMTKKVFAKKK